MWNLNYLNQDNDQPTWPWFSVSDILKNNYNYFIFFVLHPITTTTSFFFFSVLMPPEHVMKQISRIALFSIHMHMILWLTPWTAELTYKGRLTYIPFQGRHLFGEALDQFIKEITGGKSFSSSEKGNATLLQVIFAPPTAEHLLALSRL